MKTILLAFLLTAQVAVAETYYFSSVSGNDSYSATQAQNPNTPWKTINKLNTFFSSITGGDSVLFKRDETFYGQIKITKSGSSGNPIFIGAYGTGDKPVITGLTLLSFPSHQGSLYSSNPLPTQAAKLNLVLVNNVPVGMGRFPDASAPNGGYLTIDNFSGSTSIEDDDLPTAIDWDGAEMVIRPKKWVLDRDSIQSHNTGAHTITYTSASGYAPKQDFGYFIQNDSLTLTAQSEWWYNPVSKKLVFYSSSNPTNIKAATIESLVESAGQKYITFDNLYFNGANGHVLDIQSGDHINIRYCNIINAGKNGIKTEADYTSITNSTFTNCLNNGILISYSAQRCEVKNNTVKNTHLIAGMGESGNNQGIAINIAAEKATVYGNKIYNSGYIGIKFGAFDSIKIKRNIVDTFGFVKDDCGGIYTETGVGSEYKLTYGRIVDSNIVSNGLGAGYGTDDPTANDAEGIYFDNGANGIETNHNTVFNCGEGFFLHNVDKITIRYNTAYNNLNSQFSYRQDANRVISNYNCTIKDNIWFSKTSSQETGYFEATANKLNVIGTIDYNYYARPIADESTIYYDEADTDLASLPEWRAETPYDDHSKKEPTAVTSTSQIRFEYNSGISNKTVSLGGYTYVDVEETQYSGNVVLTPFTSIILIRDNITLTPGEDAYIRNGAQAGINYGDEPALEVKGSGYTRISYLRFPLTNVTDIESAKLRVYGKNSTGSETVSLSAFGVTNDSWDEDAITWNNAPGTSGSALSSVNVNNTSKYYELDVTDFVESRLANGVVSFALKNTTSATPTLSFNSKEKGIDTAQLIIMQPAAGGAPARYVARPENIVSQLESPFLQAKVYPNPIQNSFILSFPSHYRGDFTLQLIDQVGKIWNLGKQSLQPGQLYRKIDVSNLALMPGVYYLKITAENKATEVKRVIFSAFKK